MGKTVNYRLPYGTAASAFSTDITAFAQNICSWLMRVQYKWRKAHLKIKL